MPWTINIYSSPKNLDSLVSIESQHPIPTNELSIPISHETEEAIASLLQMRNEAVTYSWRDW